MHRLHSNSLRQRQILRRLNLVGTVIAVAMVVLLVFEYANLKHMRLAKNDLSDGVSSAAFQLEREFLLLRGEIDRELLSRHPMDWDKLQLRYDLLLSRIDVLQNGVGSQRLRETNAYLLVLPKLEQISAVQNLAFSSASPDRQKLSKLLEQMDLLVPDINMLSMTAAKEVNQMQETAVATLLGQHRALVWAISCQIVLLVGAAAVMLLRLRNEGQEREILRQLAKDLSEANARGESAIRGKNQFLANMSHELRTPLNGMLGMLGLLEGTQLDAAQADYIQTARRSARHLLVLLNDILDISSLDAGKMSLKPDVVRLSGLIADLETLVRPLAQNKSLGLDIVQDSNLPLWVLIDETRVKQILINLLSNAVKFSDSGTVRLSVRSDGQEASKPGDLTTVWLEVTDQGIGMSQATCERLFQRFEQGDASSTRRHEGTGLGLEISRNIARMMQGDITVVSAPGKGSTFSAQLKMRCMDSPAPQKLTPAQSVPSNAPTHPLNIVVAEDNSTNRKFMAALLAKLGHNAVFAEDGEQAVAMVNRNVPDLVLMDMHMPVMDGIVATKTLRAGPGTAASVPIIALSADVMPEMHARAKEAGINGFLSKPLDVQALQAMLSSMFPNGGRDDGSPPEPPATPAPSEPRRAAPARPPAPAIDKRALRPGAMVAHLNLNVLGEVCLIVGRDGYQEMLQDFASPQEGNLAQLLTGLCEESNKPLQRLAHSVKGEAATLGLVTLSQAAAGVEMRVADSTAEQRAEAATQLYGAWQQASALLDRLGLLPAGTELAAPSAPLPSKPAAASEATDMDELVQLTYYSTLHHKNADMLDEIHRISLRNNTRYGITGMLLFANDQVVQVLEGRRRDVRDIYRRIEADARHHDLTLASEIPQSRRQFSDWNVGICNPSTQEASRTPYFGGKPVELTALVQPGHALTLLQNFASGQLDPA